MATRYDAQGPEAEFEPGSRGRVLRNRVGICSVREMAQRESDALLTTTGQLIDDTGLDQRFTAEDICGMHRLWLGAIYPWAGQYRQVNVTKDGFMFSASEQVPRLMREFSAGHCGNLRRAEWWMWRSRQRHWQQCMRNWC